jgi:hypothetical protein
MRQLSGSTSKHHWTDSRVVLMLTGGTTEGGMAGQGDLQLSDSFDKAKQHLLWFCSLSILIALVQTSNGMFTPPLLGGDAKLEKDYLQALIWAASAYTMIALFRHLRDVDRRHSQLVYSEANDALDTSFKNMTSAIDELTRGVTHVAERFDTMLSHGQRNVESFITPFDKPIHDFKNAIKHVKGELLQAKSEPSSDWPQHLNKLDDLMQPADQCLERLEAHVRSASQTVSDGKVYIDLLAGATNATQDMLSKIAAVKREFGTLSRDIRLDHRIFYSVVDKWGSVAYFVAATIITSVDLLGWLHVR